MLGAMMARKSGKFKRKRPGTRYLLVRFLTKSGASNACRFAL
jgi:hypothetical protein